MYHIFICDDEKRFTEVLEKRVETCLKEQGQSYEIQIFYNGIEMFQAMQKKAPEILLLDIDMPEISGMKLAEQIFSSNMNTNVIFVTNRDDLVFQAIHYQPFRFIRTPKIIHSLWRNDQSISENRKKFGTVAGNTVGHCGVDPLSYRSGRFRKCNGTQPGSAYDRIARENIRYCGETGNGGRIDSGRCICIWAGSFKDGVGRAGDRIFERNADGSSCSTENIGKIFGTVNYRNFRNR